MEKGPPGLFRVRLGRQEFGRAAGASCLGADVANAMREVHARFPEASWFIASVEAADPNWRGSFGDAKPVALGSTLEASARIEATHQFAWAALAAVRTSGEPLNIPGGLLHADAPETFPLGNAVAYVRAFDSSFVEVITEDVELVRRFARAFGTGCVARAMY